MAGFKAVMKSGHPPTLLAAFLYFDFCFAIWVLNGAMAPFLSESFHLTPSQTGFMISLPILAGALMRFPLGVISQYIGRKNAALIEMSIIMVAMAFGYFFVDSFDSALAMGVMLGIAGASFGVALSLGSGWFPPEHKGLAMGIAGAGNSGTAVATLVAPVVAKYYGYHVAYAGAGFCMLIPFCVMLFFAKEPPDNEHQSVLEHIRCLWSGDGWMFNLVYIITFGGFIGLATFMPTFFYNSFAMTKVQAGIYATIATFMGSATRVLGGYLADKLGGIVTLAVVFLGAIAMFLSLTTTPSLTITVVLLMACFACLGAGNGRVVPARAAALAAVDCRGRLHDRRDWRARWLDPAQRYGTVEAAYRFVRDRVRDLRLPRGGRSRHPHGRPTLLGRQVDRQGRQGSHDEHRHGARRRCRRVDRCLLKIARGEERTLAPRRVGSPLLSNDKQAAVPHRARRFFRRRDFWFHHRQSHAALWRCDGRSQRPCAGAVRAHLVR